MQVTSQQEYRQFIIDTVKAHPRITADEVNKLLVSKFGTSPGPDTIYAVKRATLLGMDPAEILKLSIAALRATTRKDKVRQARTSKSAKPRIKEPGEDVPREPKDTLRTLLQRVNEQMDAEGILAVNLDRTSGKAQLVITRKKQETLAL